MGSGGLCLAAAAGLAAAVAGYFALVPASPANKVAGGIPAAQPVWTEVKWPFPIVHWPAGITGSIAHTREICVAAAGPDSLFRAIGFDIEDDQPLPKEIVARVATPAELGAREKDECPLGIDLPKLLFVAKEAFYKMWFPVTGIFLEFHDVAVEVDPDGGSVLASPVGGSGFDTMAGRFGRCDGMIFCYFDLPAD